MLNSPRKRRFPRRDRFVNFGLFASWADKTFRKILEGNEQHEFFAKFYSFYVIWGGAMGGVDKRIVEVFYGQRSAGLRVSFNADAIAKGTTPVQRRAVVEQGAQLTYTQNDSGTVLVSLFPAQSEDYRRQERSIILDYIKDVRILTGEGTLRKHMRYLLAYMEFSSLDGEPSWSDKALVYWLLLTRRLIMEGRVQAPRILTGSYNMAWFALVVGLSGFVLKLMEALWPSSSNVAMPAIPWPLGWLTH